MHTVRQVLSEKQCRRELEGRLSVRAPREASPLACQVTIESPCRRIERKPSANAQVSGGRMDITVEEAATRLGISVATVKRRLQKHQLSGRKIGRQWVVDDAKLPAPTRSGGAGVAAVRHLDVRQALTHLRSTDLNELWVPDVLRWADHLADPGDVMREAATRATTGRCDAATEIDVPKTPMLTRPAVLGSSQSRV